MMSALLFFNTPMQILIYLVLYWGKSLRPTWLRFHAMINSLIFNPWRTRTPGHSLKRPRKKLSRHMGFLMTLCLFRFQPLSGVNVKPKSKSRRCNCRVKLRLICSCFTLKVARYTRDRVQGIDRIMDRPIRLKKFIYINLCIEYPVDEGVQKCSSVGIFNVQMTKDGFYNLK